MHTLIIDNYDSFTFNLYQLIAEVNGREPVVVRNNHAPWSELARLGADNIVLSPGPGRPERPEDFGVCRDALLHADVPVLAVCLGHQGLAHAFGGAVTRAPEPMHGRQSAVLHDGSALFEGIPRPFSVVRYHSLVAAEPLPACLERIAWTDAGLLMAMRHRDRPLWGVQFHPESIGTEHGRRLLENFQRITRRLAGGRRSRAPEDPHALDLSVVPHRAARPPEPAPLQLRTRALELLPDAEQAFAELFADDPHAFWLDSSLVEEGLARFSFMGPSDGPHSLRLTYRVDTQELTIVERGRTTRARESIFDRLQRELERRRLPSGDLPFDFNGGFVGYLGYELKAECGGAAAHRSPLPDASFLLADRLVVFDHLERRAHLVCLVDPRTEADAEAWMDATAARLRALAPPPVPTRADAPGSVDFQLSRPRQRYLDDIDACLRLIGEGETYEVCLTAALRADIEVDPLRVHLALRRVNPAPYAAFLRMGDVAVACSSPERFLRVDRDRWIESRPIKGTAPRGETAAEDAALRERLRTSEKDRAENLMIVDLLRNDLGLVCEVGSVHAPRLMEVETYSTLHQLVSTIRGRLRPELSAVDAVRAAFPGGSMTGAPKIRTMSVIDALEGEARGIYSGAIGYFALSGAADLNIVIRTAVITKDAVSIGVGGAIVALSDPEMELEEALLKARAPTRAVALACPCASCPSCPSPERDGIAAPRCPAR